MQRVVTVVLQPTRLILESFSRIRPQQSEEVSSVEKRGNGVSSFPGEKRNSLHVTFKLVEQVRLGIKIRILD